MHIASSTLSAANDLAALNLDDLRGPRQLRPYSHSGPDEIIVSPVFVCVSTRTYLFSFQFLIVVRCLLRSQIFQFLCVLDSVIHRRIVLLCGWY